MSLTEKETKQIINIIDTLIEASDHFLKLIKEKKYSESLYIFSSIIEAYNVVQNEINKDQNLKNELLDFENRILSNIKNISSALEKTNLLKVNEYLQFNFIPTLKKWKDEIANHVSFDENKQITIGVYEDRFNPIDGYRKERLEALISEADNANANIFFFTSSDVNFDQELIAATVRDGDKWIKKDFPLPDVIHNIFPKSFTRQSKTEKKLRQLVPFTSFSFGDKLELPQRIVRNKKFAELIIPFKIINSESDVFSFLSKNKIAVLKPIRGARGENIYFVQKSGDRYRVTERRKNKIMNHNTFSTWLNATIIDHLREKTFMIQKFVEAKTKEGNPYDFRIHMQKNGEGKWQITKLYPRVGSTRSLQIEIYREGQQLLDPKYFLYEQFGDEGYEILDKMEKLAMDVTFHIDKLYGLAIDEMGLDIAIDKNKRFWMFEANNGPQTHLHETERAINTIAYCIYIAKNKIFYTNEFADSRLWKGFFNASNSKLEKVIDDRTKIGAIVGPNVNKDLIKLLSYIAEFHNITLFTFTPKDVDHHMKLIRGRQLADDDFDEKVYPYPNAIIDILNRKDEFMFVYDELEGIPIFYSTSEGENLLNYFDKVLNVMDDNTFVPTKIISSVDDALQFLNEHEKVLLFHPNQSEEKYILTSEKGYNYQLVTNSNKREMTQLTIRYFLEDILKEGNIIIQKYYAKPEFNNMSYSYNFKLMKKDKNEWEYTNIRPIYESSLEQSISLTTELNKHLKIINPINHEFSLKKLDKFGEQLESILNNSNLDFYDVNFEVIYDEDKDTKPLIVNASRGKINEMTFKEAVKLIELIKRI